MMEVVTNLMMTVVIVVVIVVAVVVMVTMPYVQEHAPHQWPGTFEWSRTKQRSWELDRSSLSHQRIGKRLE